MKLCYLPALLFSLAFFFACNGQTASKPDQQTETTPANFTCEQLEGKQYTITLTAGGKAEPPEVLSFQNKTAESSECVKYGFLATPFSCTPQADGSLAFEMVMVSEKEGRMDWKGTATATQASGTVLWVKEGQADISYTFEGTAK